ncbi:MAG: nitroreductase family deazaflavin-dependent oxidoreductase [Chloroflexi bacterium]|nr:nitroreductase family deazaflavin-dependent oxidoreductase [Chloroflexota bacterium]MBV9132782.1 nitroreductase family deazaflavin-dependent oxidoreductase [Chloroflexota bacterium]MBV9893554.1 nitroreductase family deazaflavin-dependent oxidoreductase [Chloroflexota bacterium]
MSQRYVRPDWFTKNVFNPGVRLLTGLGVSVWGSRVLAVRGRKSGQWRTTAVNLLDFEGQRFLVAPRGVTDWVRNMRASGGGELRLGPRHETIRVVELADTEKPALLRHYLRRWKWESGQFFEGVGADAPDSEIARIAPNHPVFRIV